MRSITRPRPETVHAASVMTRAAQKRFLLPILLFLLLACLSILPAHATTEATNTPSSSPAASLPPLQPPPNANAGTAADGTHQAPPSDSTPSTRHRVLFVVTHNVPRGKFHHLELLAAPHGLTVEGRYLDSIPAQSGPEVFRGYDAVFIESPLEQDVRAHLGRALTELQTPFIWLSAQHPAWQGFTDAQAKPLLAYYVNGGARNFEGFFRLLASAMDHQPAPADLPPPLEIPQVGVYHPQAPDLVFPDVPAFLRWHGVTDQRPPTIAILMHRQYLDSIETGMIDDLVARIEKQGAIAMPIFDRMLPKGSLRQLLRPDENQPPLADVIINTQIMLNAEGRRSEFTELGLPVIQANRYRHGDAAAWQADAQGLSMMEVPFFLAQPEYAGITDIQISAATRKPHDDVVAIPAQAQAVADRALALARLQRKPAGQQQLALMFWNYPAGEKNLSSSYMNIPRSLGSTADALREAGYDIPSLPPEEELITRLQRLLAPAYSHERPALLKQLLADGLAAPLPLARYRQWLDTLPEATRQALLARWGDPARTLSVVDWQGEPVFAIPRLQLGKLAILPQPGRAEPGPDGNIDREKALYHSTRADALPPHTYLATYLWVREGAAHDALIHFGTHGTQEWLPGKERGLSVYDPPMLAIGNIPVIYPYIVDNVGEATQARRRGRAVTVSHQTPPLRPAGLHQRLTELHDLLHQWLSQEEGAVKDQIRTDILARAKQERLLADLEWTEERARTDFAAFLDTLHAHLHELAETIQPVGLHTFGQNAQEEHRLATVMMMLGKPFLEAAARHMGEPQTELDETLAVDYQQMIDTSPYRLLKRYLQPDADLRELPEPLQAHLAQARQWWQALDAGSETRGLIAALQGRYRPTAYGGDPVRNPDALPTGRNLYGFDPSRVPTRHAWEAGKQAAEKLIAAHRQQHGRTPAKLAVSLWSVETMRHQGLLEAQALWLMGVEPVWDEGGRVIDVKLVPREQLGRPRVDVVLSATGLYRDHFPNAIRQLARAAQLAAEADREPDNAVAANTARIQALLKDRGLDEDSARDAAQTRIFSSEQGLYGSGLDDAALATDTWEGKNEGDHKLANLYLSRMQYAYGPNPRRWGKRLADIMSQPKGGGIQATSGASTESARSGSPDGATASATAHASGARAESLNLYAEQLRGTEGAVLSRSSNLYGMLTTDDPFQYLGGIGLAVRHLDGKAPELYISNLRTPGSGRVERASQFLSRELATRQFHPGYIQGLMAEGYAGTLEVLDATNNLWGWTAVAREIVRDDQWQEMVDVYVRDKHQLGLKDWFEQHNPHALAQTIERMLEAARQGYWQTDAQTLTELKERWQDLAQRFEVRSENARFMAYVQNGTGTAPKAAPQAPADAPSAASNAPGFGMQAPSQPTATAPATPASSQTSAPPAEPRQPPEQPPQQPAKPVETVRGQRLEPVKQTDTQPPARTDDSSWLHWLGALGIVLLILSGARHQKRRAWDA